MGLYFCYFIWVHKFTTYLTEWRILMVPDAAFIWQFASCGYNFRAKIHSFVVSKTRPNATRTVLVTAARLCVRAAAWRRCFIANYWLGYYLCMYPFPGRSLYCCGRAVDGVMMALSEYKWSIKHAQREQKYSMYVLDSQGVEH